MKLNSKDVYINKDNLLKKRSGFLTELIKNRVLFFMLLPGVIILVLFNYLPMFGTIIAFKNLKYSFSDNFFINLFKSDWVGFDNFKFLFGTSDAFRITRNTLLYNAAFIVIGLSISVVLALMLNEIRSRRLARFYQSAMFLPYFLSWVVISYLAFAFLSADNGYLNRVVFKALGIEPISWYSDTRPWPFILIFVNCWKWCGYNSIIFLSAMIGIDPQLYEAAMIDGASKWKQITKITIPSIMPVILMITLLSIGRIFNADFGLFFQVPRNTGMLYPVTNVIDTYVYNGLLMMGDVGMSSAAALYQSVVGFVLVFIANRMVAKIDKDSALF